MDGCVWKRMEEDGGAGWRMEEDRGGWWMLVDVSEGLRIKVSSVYIDKLSKAEAVNSWHSKASGHYASHTV